MKKYIVKLSQEQRQQLEDLISRGQAAARKLMHARVLLKTDQGEHGPGWSDERIAEALEVGLATIERIRRRFAQEGCDDALNRRPQPERPQKRKIPGEKELFPYWNGHYAILVPNCERKREMKPSGKMCFSLNGGACVLFAMISIRPSAQ